MTPSIDNFLQSSPPRPPADSNDSEFPGSPTAPVLNSEGDSQTAGVTSSPSRHSSQASSSPTRQSTPLPISGWRGADNRLKRPSEDLTQYANSVSRRIRLKPSRETELRDFAKLPTSQQNVFLAALLMNASDKLAEINIPDAVYNIPTNLKTKIEKFSFVVLIDPSIPAYVQDDLPVRRLRDFLLKYPGWGLTSAVADDPSKNAVITARIAQNLTDIRSRIKLEIERSLGYTDSKTGSIHPSMDISALCHKIVMLRQKIAPSVKVSIKMAARVAFLREKFAAMRVGSKVGRDYWEKVDKTLNNIRLSKNGDPARISAVFARYLRDDQSRYGLPADMADLVADDVNIDSIVDEIEIREGE